MSHIISYFLHQYLNTYRDWCVFSSKLLKKDSVLFLADLFAISHGRIEHPENSNFDIWSISPINIFRYKLLENLGFDNLSYAIDEYNIPGYIIEGAYWSNGFIYHVRNEEFNQTNYVNDVIEINLYIDSKSRKNYDYPEFFSSVTDIMNLALVAQLDRASDF